MPLGAPGRLQQCGITEGIRQGCQGNCICLVLSHQWCSAGQHLLTSRQLKPSRAIELCNME